MEKFDKCNDFPIRHIDSRDIPVWGEDLLPQSAQLLMFVTEKDFNCGQFMPFIYKLPASFISPASGQHSRKRSTMSVEIERTGSPPNRK